MHSVDLVDETFIAAPVEVLAGVVAEPARWRRWWPQRRMEVFMDRGLKGQRWAVAGDLVGTSEIWLENYRDGVILHYYLRADPDGPIASGRASRRALDGIRRREALRWKASVWELKRELERGRAVGAPVPA